MAITVENFIRLANFYNQTLTTMSAICVEKGGLPLENYVGRFFAADVLEFVVEYGNRLMQNKSLVVPSDVSSVIERLRGQFENVKSMVTPSQKPIYEMTLEEFEKIMNI